MVLKKITALPIAMCLVFASLFALALSGRAQADSTTLYWCHLSDGNFSSSADWSTVDGSCVNTGNLVPTTGDSLVFDTSIQDGA